MNNSLKAILIYLLNKKYIGGRHTPENRLIKSKTKWIDKEEEGRFDKEYKKMINQGIILRQKKKTGKGSDWHISLNPRKLKEVYEMLK